MTRSEKKKSGKATAMALLPPPPRTYHDWEHTRPTSPVRKMHKNRRMKQGLVDAVGNTPMVELPSLSAATGCRIVVKLDYLNPTGSVKDRAALGMVRALEGEGVTELVEATAGNTGIALAGLCRARDLRLTVCLPDTTAAGKVALLRALAHEVVLCPSSAKMGEPLHFQTQAAAIAAERGARYVCQFDNPANAAAHRATTGPELWRQSGERLDAVAVAAGTGGTIAGVSQHLTPLGVKCYMANPQSSGVTVEEGRVRLKSEQELLLKRPSIMEGIGSGRLYANLASAVSLAAAVEVSDREAIAMTRYLLRHEGFFVGGSSGVNLCAAVRVARLLGPDHTIATILCDSGSLYVDKHWSPQVLLDLGLSPDCDKDLSFLDAVDGAALPAAVAGK